MFQVPSRRLLSCATEPRNGKPPNARDIFERAREVVAEEQARLDAEAAAPGGRSTVLLRITQQAAGILAKVAELDEFMREPPMQSQTERERWLVEAHPEMCFRAIAGGLLPPSKASAHGQLQRLALVHREFPDADQRIRAWELGRKYSLLDICDAYAACWSALRWGVTGGGIVDRRSAVTPSLEVLGETAPGVADREIISGLAMRMVV